MGQLHQIKGTIDLFPDVRFGHLAIFQAKGDIVVNRFVRKQGVVLKHQSQIAFVDRQGIDPFATDQQIAFGNVGQPGNHAKCRGLAAARWTQKGHEAVVRHGQIHALHGGKFAVTLDDILQFDRIFDVSHHK